MVCLQCTIKSFWFIEANIIEHLQTGTPRTPCVFRGQARHPRLPHSLRIGLPITIQPTKHHWWCCGRVRVHIQAKLLTYILVVHVHGAATDRYTRALSKTFRSDITTQDTCTWYVCSQQFCATHNTCQLVSHLANFMYAFFHVRNIPSCFAHFNTSLCVVTHVCPSTCKIISVTHNYCCPAILATIANSSHIVL